MVKLSKNKQKTTEPVDGSLHAGAHQRIIQIQHRPIELKYSGNDACDMLKPIKIVLTRSVVI
jgi:hypothetical protein